MQASSTKKRSKILVLAALAVTAQSARSEAQALKSAIERYAQARQKPILRELLDAVSIPSVASDRENIRRKAGFLRDSLERRGFRAALLETEGNPLVYGDRPTPGATRTLLLYAHYDGQPVDRSKWSQPDPFVPVLRSGKLEDGAPELDFEAQESFDPDWRIYGRSVSDDTGPVVALLAALDALDSIGTRPTSNLRVVLDGEEEAGSGSLVSAIDHYRDELEADLMLVLDGPLHPSGRPTIVYGARGIVTFEVTVYGPKFPLHSGHYGNWAPNPAMLLARLLASMKDDDGRVLVEGFYDGVELTDADRNVMASVPDDLEGLKAFFGFSRPDAVGKTLQEALQYPSLNVRGLESGWVGADARTIVPSQATAAIDIRLVAETDADATYGKVVAHIEKQGYHVVSADPDDSVRASYGRIAKVTRTPGSNAYRTPLDEPRAAPVVDALTEMFSAPPVRLRTSGGTVPISPFIRALGFPALSAPTVNFDNNQHSPNENLRLGHFFESVVTFAALLTM
jgi:acetylornithine deacetylase/succinyl-diaminopimelate desuccinylase-like protein